MNERHVGPGVGTPPDSTPPSEPLVPQGPTDGQLLQRARAGDSKAFDALVERHVGSLYELAAMMIGNTTDAQDIVQETLLGAYQGMHRFEGRSAVRTWLVGILVKQAAMHRRREGRQRMVSLESGAAENIAAPAGSGRQSGEAGADARMDLAELLGRVSEEHRQVLVLRELEGLSYDEMSQMLGVPRGTVESRLFRARQALKESADWMK